MKKASQENIIPTASRAIANNTQAHAKMVQRTENNTGLPDTLKTGIEHVAGFSLNDVKVHYNSDKPAQLHAFAYAQGNNIHIASGQERHLPHEAWHVVQQKQGRVQATQQTNGVAINDDKGLEHEADVKGAGKAALKNSFKTAKYPWAVRTLLSKGIRWGMRRVRKSSGKKKK